MKEYINDEGIIVKEKSIKEITCLIIDTCTWINIGQTFYNDLLFEFLSLVYRHEIRLIVPKQVKDEWERHKVEKIKTNLVGSLRGSLNTASKLKELIEDKDRKNEFKQFIDAIRSEEERIVNKTADYNIMTIEQMMSHVLTKVIDHSDDVIKKSVEWALQNKRPFRKNKNSIGDALIMFSAIEHAKENEYKEVYFISNNTEDFSDDKNKKEIHSDIKPLFDEANIKYSINLPEVLKNVFRSSIRDEIVQDFNNTNIIEQKQYCPKCSDNVEMYGSWKPSYAGLTWQYTCPKCRYSIDTGDYFDY